MSLSIFTPSCRTRFSIYEREPHRIDLLPVLFTILTLPALLFGQASQASEITKRAVDNLGGDKYLNVKSQIGRGRYSIFREGAVVSFQSFVDVIVFPEKERTEFRDRGIKTTQTNTGSTGWIFDGEQDIVRDQTEIQIANFKRGIRTSLDNLLRGGWRGEAELTYVGKRPATLGKRNDVVKLAYKDGLNVEFEFSADDGMPQKAIYKTTNADGEEITEDRIVFECQFEGAEG